MNYCILGSTNIQNDILDPFHRKKQISIHPQFYQFHPGLIKVWVPGLVWFDPGPGRYWRVLSQSARRDSLGNLAGFALVESRWKDIGEPPTRKFAILKTNFSLV